MGLEAASGSSIDRFIKMIDGRTRPPSIPGGAGTESPGGLKLREGNGGYVFHALPDSRLTLDRSASRDVPPGGLGFSPPAPARSVLVCAGSHAENPLAAQCRVGSPRTRNSPVPLRHPPGGSMIRRHARPRRAT